MHWPLAYKIDTSYEEICQTIKKASEGNMKGIILYTDEPVVSTDFIGKNGTKYIFIAQHGCKG